MSVAELWMFELSLLQDIQELGQEQSPNADLRICTVPWRSEARPETA